MAYDKVVDGAALDSIFTDIADAIRTKNGSADAIAHTAMAAAIEDIEAGGGAVLETGTLTVTDNGMFEPGYNEYVLSSDNLRLTSRLIICVEVNGALSCAIHRESINGDFYVDNTLRGYLKIMNANEFTATENSFRALGNLTGEDEVSFIAI